MSEQNGRTSADPREVAALRAEVERLRMKAGRLQARVSVFMQAMGWLARNGHQVRAQRWIARADESAADVRPEDFVVAKPCALATPKAPAELVRQSPPAAVRDEKGGAR